MKKIFAVLLILTLSLPASTAYAGYVLDSNGNFVLSEDSYTADGKIKVYSLWDRYSSNVKLSMELPKIEMSIPKLTFSGADDKIVDGVVTYPNYNDIKPGKFDLQWTFTPYDNKYETINGVLSFEVWPEDSEASKGKLPDPEPEQPTTPSLTATSVQLSTLTAYDINLNNKVSGSSYSWTSSDKSVAEVGKGGLVKAKKEGSAVITCDITYPDESKTTLSSLVTVGYDDNAPVLTETDIDLSIGDTFDINLENTIAKSKYRWSTSNKAIVKVNSANGKIVAVSTGKAYVTCAITTPDKQVIVLRCDIAVTE